MAKRKKAAKAAARKAKGSARRAGQLRELFGVEFPGELFEFWDWYCALPKKMQAAFHGPLGMVPGGVLDALAGKFDGVKLRYPAVLHYRYAMDPPEFFTLFTGDSDGLHWGYWFDDPGRLPPVVASYYSRDAYELYEDGWNLFEAIHSRAERAAEGLAEYLEYEPEEAAFYRKLIGQLAALRKLIPKPAKATPRKATYESFEGMGVVAPKGAAARQLVEARRLWVDDHAKSFDALEQAYIALDREPLAEVVRIHRKWPWLPSVDVLEFKPGDYHVLAEALLEPDKVRRLTLDELDRLPDLSMFGKLESLALYGNKLTTLPKSLAKCSRLKSLNLHRNRFQKIPDVLFELTNLTEVHLSDNDLSSLGDLKRFQRLKKLRSFGLAGNPLDEAELARLQKLLPKLDVY